MLFVILYILSFCHCCFVYNALVIMYVNTITPIFWTESFKWTLVCPLVENRHTSLCCHLVVRRYDIFWYYSQKLLSTEMTKCKNVYWYLAYKKAYSHSYFSSNINKYRHKYRLISSVKLLRETNKKKKTSSKTKCATPAYLCNSIIEFSFF